MTTLLFILLGVFAAYGIISAFCPTVDGTDIELEKISSEEEKQTEINEILGVSITPDGKTTEVCLVDETVIDFTELTESIDKILPPVEEKKPDKAPVYFDIPLSEEIQDHIYRECVNIIGSEYLGDMIYLPAVITAIIKWETGFNPDNTNGKNHGYMSVATLKQETMDAWGIKDLMDPYDNITAGIHCFKNALDWAFSDCAGITKGPDDLVIAALIRYNKGSKGAQKLISENPNDGFFGSKYARKVYDTHSYLIGEFVNKYYNKIEENYNV